MSESIASNGAAFPHFVPNGHYNGSVHYPGMSLLDYFAGQALPEMVKLAQRGLLKDESLGADALLGQIVAAQSYAIAVDMLKERERITSNEK